MKILFLHGWHSTPGGRKPTYLLDLGHQVANPALCPDDFAKACLAAQQAFDAQCPDVVVGSSRGGAVAMALQRGETPLVLMCPAYQHFGDVNTVLEPVLILHSRGDEVIPFHHSEELVAASGLSPTRLVETGVEHRLASVQALDSMVSACRSLVSTGV
jgi:predicted esterase YcpF (UPF0227 family)